MKRYIDFTSLPDITGEIAQYVRAKKRTYSPLGKSAKEARCCSAIQHTLEELANEIEMMVLNPCESAEVSS